jgi:hypothetical protein
MRILIFRDGIKHDTKNLRRRFTQASLTFSGVYGGHRMFNNVLLFSLFLMTCLSSILYAAEDSSDAPEYARDPKTVFKAAESYEHALLVWKTPEDITAWIAANFSYDMARAARFSETQIEKQGPIAIYTPSEFFATKSGVCIDLSRFAVETLRAIDPQTDPQYIMIEFNPIQISVNIFRRHWLGSFKRDGKTYFFADSKRPGFIDGPYNDTPEFIREYERYRARNIVTFREMGSFQKRQRTPALKLKASEKR